MSEAYLDGWADRRLAPLGRFDFNNYARERMREAEDQGPAYFEEYTKGWRDGSKAEEPLD